MAQKERIHRLIGHTDEQIKTHCKNLTLFEPHDLRSLIGEARKSGDGAGLDQAVVVALKRHNQRQLVDLLRRLGIDPAHPNAWQRGFFRLACHHYGVGRLAWQRLRTKRNAATWAPSHDLTLLMEVTKLKAAGKSELQAIKRIVSNPRTRQLFPYREQKNRPRSYYSLQNEIKRREAALWRHLQFLKASSTEKSILNQLLGPGWDTEGHIERICILDFPTTLPKGIMKIKSSSR